MRKVIYYTMNGIFDTLKDARANGEYLVDVVDTATAKVYTQTDLDEIAKRWDGIVRVMSEK